MNNETKPMTVAEAGRRGGQSTKSKLGRDHFVAMGRKGGEATKAAHGPDFYENIGRKGGKKGGDATMARYGREFYQVNGAKGGAKVKAMIAAGKAALEAEKAS